MLYIYKHTCIDKSISIYYAYFLFRNLCCVVYSLCCVQVFVTPWTIAHQAPLSMGFPRQEYWSGLFSVSSSLPLYFALFPIFLSTDRTSKVYSLHVENFILSIYKKSAFV